MATLRQSAQSNFAGADPATATYSSTPVEGNLLIAVGSERSGGDATNHALTGITGWTETIQRTTESGNGTYRRTHSMYWKAAGASESTSVTLDDGTSNDKWLSIYEFEFETGEDQWVLLDSISNDNGTTSDASTIGSGTTGSQSGEMFVVASTVMKRKNNGTDSAPHSYDSGLTIDQTYDPASSNDMCHSLGSDAKDTTSGTKSTTCTLSAGSNLGLSCALLVFDVEGGAGAAGPRSPMGHPINGFLRGPI